MNSKSPFKWRHFLPSIILLNVRWYLRYPLSYRNLEEMMMERGLSVDHTTIYRVVLQREGIEVKSQDKPWITLKFRQLSQRENE